MAKFKTTTSSSVARNNLSIEFPGTYHMVVTKIDPEPLKKSGERIDALCIHVGVVAGTDQRCVGNNYEVYLNNPSHANKDGGEFLRRIQTRFFFVTKLVAEDQLDKEVEIDLDDAIGRQFIAKFSEEEYQGKKQVKLSGVDMWHVDDPYVKDIPKDSLSINQIAKDLRMVEKSPSKPVKTHPAAKVPATQYQEPTVASSSVDVDAL